MSNILLHTSGGIATITLNRPEKLNAFVGTMREDLVAALEKIADDASVRVVVITGAGRAFCSGGDLESMADLQKEKNVDAFSKLLDAGREIVTTIRQMPQIVIASINGVAAGAGCNLALACDYRLATQHSKLGETFIRIGLHPDWGGTFFLPRLAGPSRAIEMMATGRMVDAAEALEAGMIDKIVADHDLSEETHTLAHALAESPRELLAAIKRSIYASAVNSLDQQLELETRAQLEAFASADAREGMAAFFEKRKPKFAGS
jgi:Enoyl-CoA hydratase/carnithine racemase